MVISIVVTFYFFVKQNNSEQLDVSNNVFKNNIRGFLRGADSDMGYAAIEKQISDSA
jgi:hypothetical protein